MELQKGYKVKFADLAIGSQFKVECRVESSLNIDVSCFGLHDDKLEDENYMIFYNQTQSPKGEITYERHAHDTVFDISLTQLPPNINKLVFTAAVDGDESMKQLGSLLMRLGPATFRLTGSHFNQEKAIIIAEVYQKDGLWRLGAVGAGFQGGLASLITYFGGQVAPTHNHPHNTTHIAHNTHTLDSSHFPAVPSVAIASTDSMDKKNVFLEKRVNLEKTMERVAPQLVSLAKKAAVSLEKRGLGEHRAKVALCLDISGSMSKLYQKGIVQEFVERILALGCRLDDDASIDIFLFGANGYQPKPIGINDFKGYVARTVKSLEPDTKYASAIELVRKFYTDYRYERSEPQWQDTPVYVMFLTDGQPSDKAQATRALKNASYEPLFWQFMGVGDADFSYLEKLDDLTGRYIDNADFFAVPHLQSLSDEQLYERLINEYPGWLQRAKQKNLLS